MLFDSCTLSLKIIWSSWNSFWCETLEKINEFFLLRLSFKNNLIYFCWFSVLDALMRGHISRLHNGSLKNCLQLALQYSQSYWIYCRVTVNLRNCGSINVWQLYFEICEMNLVPGESKGFCFQCLKHTILASHFVLKITFHHPFSTHNDTSVTLFAWKAPVIWVLLRFMPQSKAQSSALALLFLRSR